MSDCCKNIFKETLKDVLLLIEHHNINSIDTLKKTLQHAINLEEMYLKKEVK